MIRRIFLDLDDVCNTLAPHILNCVGCHVDPHDYSQCPRQFGYQIQEAANFLLGRPKFADAGQFWSSITRTNWSDCPTSDIFPWILYRAERLVGRGSVRLATSPTKCPESLAGKLDWIHKHMPPWMHRQYHITPRKWDLARPDALLIDDREENLDLFRQEGGHGVLVPAPWNRLWGANAFKAIEDQLRNVGEFRHELL